MGFFDKFKKKAAETVSEKQAPAAPAPTPTAGPIVLTAPVAGSVIAMADVPDPAFGSEMLGRGCAVWPETETVVAPTSGTVSVVMSHAIGLTADNGAEVLVHVGIDTVSMQGDGFVGYVAQGDHVDAGQKLLDFDRAKIAAAGHKDCVVLAVSNSADYAAVELAVDAGATVAAGDTVLALTK